MSAYNKTLHIPKWKKNLESKPSISELSLVSIYDLYFGTSLAHDIIYLNEALYTNLANEIVNNPRNKADILAAYNDHGFDIFPVPSYDTRAHKYHDNATGLDYYRDGFQTFTNLSEVVTYLKEKAGFGSSEYEVVFEGFRPISISTEKYSNKITFKNQIDLYLYDEVEDKLIETSEAYLFEKVRVNMLSRYIRNIFEIAVKGAFDLSNEEAAELIGKLRTTDYVPDRTDADFTARELFMLKHTFVWVRGAFCGDYVDKTSFEQDLNDRENPRWRNIVLSGKPTYSLSLRALESGSGLEDYDEFESNSNSPFTYYPKTAPSVDYLEKNYASGENETLAEFLEKAANFGEIDVIERLNHPAYTTTGAILGTPMWFDFFNKDRNSFYKEKPFIIPKDGNLNIDGRIISPTIDELWQALKMIFFGHGNDGADDGVIGLKQTVNTNDIDSSLKNLKHFHFDYKGEEKFGDIVDYDLSSADGTTVTRFIADPTQHTLRFDDYIASEMKIFTDISSSKGNYDKYSLDFYKKFKNIKSNNFKNLIFENGGKTHSIDEPLGNGEDLVALISEGNQTREYEIGAIYSSLEDEFDDLNLSPYPLSLRQLESRILNQAFTLKNFSRFVLNTFVPSAPFASKGNSTLYTLHRGYNLEVETPNTNYLDSMKHELPTVKGSTSKDYFSKYTTFEAYKNEVDKLDLSDDELYKHHYLIWLNDKWSPISDVKDYKISPTGAENVFLNAKGEWRTTAEFCYIPTLHMEW